MPPRPALGTSEFHILRKAGALYVDKTAWVARLFEDEPRIILLTRPRRFGKSLFLSTIKAFAERSDLSGTDSTAAFQDLAIWRSEPARAHHQRYPVIHLSFKDLDVGGWEDMKEGVATLFAEAVAPLFPRLAAADLNGPNLALLHAVLERRATDHQLTRSMRILTEELHRLTGEPAVVLIDEYDAPLHAAWLKGYYEPAIQFFRAALGSLLKDNPAVHRSVITGILRVARESLFSTLNHVTVYSVLSEEFSTAIGFTEEEVTTLMSENGLEDPMDGVRAWYNGYRFGEAVIYNPWSILSFLASPSHRLQPYWSNTGGTDLIERLLDAADPEVAGVFEQLLVGQTVRVPIEESRVMSDLMERDQALWSLLLAAGYLKVLSMDEVSYGTVAELAIPNKEINRDWRRIFSRWFNKGLRGATQVDRLTRAMLRGEAAEFQWLLQDVVTASMSAHLTDRRQPERVWQAFVLGLLVHLSTDYEVQSEREAGFGRADVTVRPRRPGLPGAVLELKRQDAGEDPEAALESALQQLRERDYAAALRQAGAGVVREIGVVFEGRRVWVRFR